MIMSPNDWFHNMVTQVVFVAYTNIKNQLFAFWLSVGKLNSIFVTSHFVL